MAWKLLSYSIFFWVTFFIITSLFIVDRFTTNVWPRQSFATEGHGTGTDRISFKDGPATVIAYQAIARLSGRYTMAALNALFFTMMHSTHRYLSDSWVGNYLIDFKDDVARITVHKWLGISLCIVTLLHVWSILFPVMFSGYSVEVRLGYFSWPLSEQAPKGFQDVNSTTTTMMMQGDDVYRLILMSLLLGPIIYLSVRWLCSNYRIGIRLHQFIMLMYYVDIVRRHTHPHSWVFNTPALFAWIFDCAWGHYYSAQRTSVETINISSDYMLVLWKSKDFLKKRILSIGDVFTMRLIGNKSKCCCCSLGCCAWERDHPFTSFSKRDAHLSNMKMLVPYNNKLTVNFGNKTDVELIPNEQLRLPKDTEDDIWDRGIVVRTYNGDNSHTKLMREKENLVMDIWGRFRSGAIANYLINHHDLVLVGGGSGSGYLIDTLFFLSKNSAYIDEEVHIEKNNNNDQVENGESVKKKSVVCLIFSTNDLYLVQWWTNVIENILINNTMPVSKRLHITIALTNGNGASHGVTSLTAHGVSWGKIMLGRCNIEKEIETITLDSKNKCDVFCQGGESLQNATKKAAKLAGKTYHEGHSFDNCSTGDSKYCGCFSRKKVSPV